MDMLEWSSGIGTSGGFGTGTSSSYGGSSGIQGGESVHSMMVDEDYMELMTDTLFSTISSNQPIYFPDPREIGQSPLPFSFCLSQTQANLCSQICLYLTSETIFFFYLQS